MNRYNPDIHHRRSIRLKQFDYSSNNAYFVTICSQNRELIFGDVIDNKIVLNNVGQMINKWILETENKFKNNICIDEYIIMPNHFHCIIILQNFVGADLRVCPDIKGAHTSAEFILSEVNGLSTGSGAPLHKIIQWFKTMTTNEYIRGVNEYIYPPFDKRLWQKNYYERIIRNDKEFAEIREYIINNPVNWLLDENNINKDYHN